MRCRLVLPVVLAVAVVGLSGCNDASSTSSADEPSSSSSAGPSGSPSGTPTESSGEPTGESTDMPSGSPGAQRSYDPRRTPDNLPRSRIEAANLHYAYLGSNPASTAEEKAVVTAWMSYWQGAADTYYLYRPTELFESVARAKARNDVIGYLGRLKAKHHRVAGWAEDNITSVKVTGSSAMVRDCTENFTFTVDRESEPVSRVVPFYDATGNLEKVDGTWTVVTQKSRELTKSCLG